MKKGNILIVCILLLGFSCNNVQKELLTNSTGKSGEISIIIEKNIWNQTPGDILRNIFTRYQPALPQEEPMFVLYHITHSSFDNYFQTNRNIIFIKCGQPSYPLSIKTSIDVWAKPQAYMEISAPDINQLTDLIQKNSDEIVDFFTLNERTRIQNTYKSFQDKLLNKKLSEHNINLIIPKGYKLIVDTTDFLWISSETVNTSQGIFIYEYNYTDSNTFNNSFILAKRDTILKTYVPGPLSGSWMTTEHDYPVTSKMIKLNKKVAFEVRGLWKVQNDFMGGPFVSLTTVDTNRNKIITIEGYVYAPKSDKLNLIRQLEAILYTLKLKN